MKAMNSLIAALVFAVCTPLHAGDVEDAVALKGQWQGSWRLGNNKPNKLQLTITGNDKSAVKGEAVWGGLGNGEVKMAIDKGEVRKGTLQISHTQGMTLELKPTADGKGLQGSWGSAAGGGAVELTRNK